MIDDFYVSREMDGAFCIVYLRFLVSFSFY